MAWALLIIPIVIALRIAVEFKRRLDSGNRNSAFIGLPLEATAYLGFLAFVVGAAGMNIFGSDGPQATFKLVAIAGAVAGVLGSIGYFSCRKMFRQPDRTAESDAV